MKPKFTYYFIPAFLVVYFFIALLPVVGVLESELFPFFSFKLYSKIPNGFYTYDLLIHHEEGTQSFLVHGNPDLNVFQKKRFRIQVNELGARAEKGDSISAEEYVSFLPMGDSLSLVRLSGDYVRAVRDDDFQVTLLKKLK